MHKQQERTSMMRQILSIPNLMEFMERDINIAIERLNQDIDFTRFRKVILTGCGDSLCVGKAVKYAFMKYTGMETEVVTAIELSRYYEMKHISMDQGCLVIAISNSGNVSRIVEAVKRVRKSGGFVVSITGNTESETAKNSNHILKINVPKFEYAPGIRSYCGCLLAAYKLAVHIGGVISYLPKEEIEDICNELSGIPDQLESFMRIWEGDTYLAAKRLQPAAGYELVAAGYHYANAWFGYAKSLETTGKPTSAINTEDWFHMNYFVKDVYHTGTIAIANKHAADASRMEELIQTALPMGRPLLVITDHEALQVDHKIITPSLKEELLHIFVQYLPISMLFSHLGDLLGEVYFRDGKDNWTACVNFATIAKSKEIIIE